MMTNLTETELTQIVIALEQEKISLETTLEKHKQLLNAYKPSYNYNFEEGFVFSNNPTRNPISSFPVRKCDNYSFNVSISININSNKTTTRKLGLGIDSDFITPDDYVKVEILPIKGTNLIKVIKIVVINRINYLTKSVHESTVYNKSDAVYFLTNTKDSFTFVEEVIL